MSKQSVTRLIVGLGNPGTKYAGTRHNVGADFIRFFANHVNTPLATNKKLNCDLGFTKFKNEWTQTEEEWILAIPDVYINSSGPAVLKLMSDFNVRTSNVVVCHDCLDHAISRVALKFGGSARGHNGLRSIGDKTNTLDFWRIRFGIGRPEGTSAHSVRRYVLAPWKPEEIKAIEEAFKVVSTKLLENDSKFQFSDLVV
jgi:PTH1 family peptidyl-tRNA hydrolase